MLIKTERDDFVLVVANRNFDQRSKPQLQLAAVAKVAQLREAGKSRGEIAAEMGLAKSTVARIVEETAA
jgi:hypothetical protein